MWIRAYEIEDDFGTVETAEALLRQAVAACPKSEPLWLLLIQLKFKKDETLAANAKNPAILSSERIWLTAFQVGLNFGGKL